MRHAAVAALTAIGLALVVGCSGSQVMPPQVAPTPSTHTSDRTDPTPGRSAPAGSRTPGDPSAPVESTPTVPSDPAIPGDPAIRGRSGSPSPRPNRTPTASTTSSPRDGLDEPSEPAPQAPPVSPEPSPSPTSEPVPAWREAIFTSRTGGGPDRFTGRERFTSCGDSTSEPGSELLSPDLVRCLDDGGNAGGAEAAVAVLTETDNFHVWFVRVSPTGAEFFLDSRPDTGHWWHGTCDATQSIANFDCTEPTALSTTEESEPPDPPDPPESPEAAQTPQPTQTATIAPETAQTSDPSPAPARSQETLPAE